MVCPAAHGPSLLKLNFSSGMTETSTTVAMVPLSQKVGTLGGVGQLIPGVRARVVKVDGTLAKPGEPGELVVKSPSLALRYLNNARE
jgi:acyl-CoA synthetase (AMP-forming)/AMP-acid ligase II